MAFGKHALKVIAVFVVLFLVGVILKLFGLFDGESTENFEDNTSVPDYSEDNTSVPGYSESMTESQFRDFVNQHTKGNNEKLKSIPSDIMNSFSPEHQQIIQDMINELNTN